MGGSSRRLRLCSGVAIASLILVLGATGSANAQAATEAQIKALQAQVEVLMRTVKELKKRKRTPPPMPRPPRNRRARRTPPRRWPRRPRPNPSKPVIRMARQQRPLFLERKPGKALTFYTPGGEITAYGQFDISFEGRQRPKSGPVERTVICRSETSAGCRHSTSLLGVRGFQRIQINRSISSTVRGRHRSLGTPGTKQSNSN